MTVWTERLILSDTWCSWVECSGRDCVTECSWVHIRQSLCWRMSVTRIWFGQQWVANGVWWLNTSFLADQKPDKLPCSGPSVAVCLKSIAAVGVRDNGDLYNEFGGILCEKWPNLQLLLSSNQNDWEVDATWFRLFQFSRDLVIHSCSNVWETCYSVVCTPHISKTLLEGLNSDTNSKIHSSLDTLL